MKILSIVISVLALSFSGYLFVKINSTEKQLHELTETVDKLTTAQNPVVPVPSDPGNPFTNPPVDQINQPGGEVPAYGGTSISFTKTAHDFGKIKAGEKVKTKFHFKNTGTNPLIFSNAVGSCGCTVPSYPRQALQPGEEGDIDVEFDSSGKRGEEIKTVTITANTEPKQIVLTIKATVIPPAQ